jgi:hypothetical protein
VKVTIGCCCDLIPPAPLGLYKGWHDAGARVIRYMPWTPNINRAEGVWDWSKADHDMQVFHDAGLKVYFNPLFYPAHWTNGQPWGMPYTAGWCVLDSSGVPVWDETKNSIEPEPLSKNAVREFGERCAERYAHQVALWSAGVINEPGIQMYWPPSKWELGDDGKRVRLGPNTYRLFAEAMEPFIEGVRSVDLTAQFVGPEADSHGFIQELTAKLHVPIRYSFHGYPRSEPQVTSAIDRIDDEFEPAFYPPEGNSYNGPKMNTEMGFTPNTDGEAERLRDYFAACERRNVSHVFLYDFTQAFKAGTIEQNTGWRMKDGQLKNGATAYELSAAGEFLRSYGSGIGKHRAATS